MTSLADHSYIVIAARITMLSPVCDDCTVIYARAIAVVIDTSKDRLI